MNNERTLLAVRYAALTALAILCVGPILIMFLTSFKTQSQTFTTGLSFFFVPTLENYRDVIFDSSFGRYLINSLIVGVVATLLTLLLGCMAAYGLARFSFAGRKTVAYATLMLRTVPLAVIAVPVFMIWSDWKLTNSLAGLILLYVAVNLPFTIWLLYGFVLQVPQELEEAAAIDGCGPIRTYFNVVLPMLKPTMISVGVLEIMWVWNDYLLPYLVLDRKKYMTIPIHIQFLQGSYGSVDLGAVMALIMLSIIPVIIFYLTCQKHIIKGVAAGAVKG